MTLPDFLEFEPLNRLRRLMKAPLPEGFSAGYVINHLNEDLDRALEGIEGVTIDDISDVRVLPDGTLAYKDRRVLLYIRDRRAFREYDPRDNLPKFHVADCKTLDEMREHGQFEKYVISRRTDGKFKMNFIYAFDKQESEICELKVCRNCLTRISYRSYKRTSSKQRTEIYNDFSLSEYFTTHGRNLITVMPLHTDDTAPINEYRTGFREASQRYRADNGWRCQNCGIDLSDPSYRKYLHTHHLNAQKYDDRRENHKALCIRCHAGEPMHTHLKNSPDYRQFMGIYGRLLASTERTR